MDTLLIIGITWIIIGLFVIERRIKEILRCLAMITLCLDGDDKTNKAVLSEVKSGCGTILGTSHGKS